MAHFRAVIRGNRGDASRLGSKDSGMVAHVDGWHTGATVRIWHCDGRDLVSVYRNGGSNGNGTEKLVAQWFAAEPITLGDAVAERPNAR